MFHRDAAVNGFIRMTSLERRIFDTVLAVTLQPEAPQGTIVRVAGGWVRDKILGHESHDIDLVVNNMKGQAFAEAVNRYLSEQGVNVAKIGIILANPAQSKHLDTVTFKIHGQKVDVNNLRTEVYNPMNRIPVVTFGTPLQDAMRRDLTINTLFYNINNDTVEDWSGQGLQDLKVGVIRTPMDPMQTIKDDPLRVLRAIRFAGRFGYSVSPDLATAARHPQTRYRLHHLVSRERCGIEVEKMLTQSNPVRSFRLMVEFGLYSIVFKPPQEVVIDPELKRFPFFPVGIQQLTWQELGSASLELMQGTQKVLIKTGLSSPVRNKDVLLAAFLAPLFGYADMTVKRAFRNTTQRGLPFRIIRSLKLSNNTGNTVMCILTSARDFIGISHTWLQLLEKQVTLRQTGETKQPPRAESATTITTGSIAPLAPKFELEVLEEKNIPRDLRLRIGHCLRHAEAYWKQALELADVMARHFHAFILERYLPSHLLREWIRYSGLIGCYRWKPLMGGNQIRSELRLNGKLIGECIAEQIVWRLLHPRGSIADGREYITQWARKLLQRRQGT